MEDLALVATVPVAKGKATFKSGPKKGKLRPGCRFKSKRTYCTPEVAARLGVSKPKARGRGRRGPIIAKTPQGAERQAVFQALLESRKRLKMAREMGDCGQLRHSAQKIAQALNYMSRLPVKKTKSNPTASPSVRNARYQKELERIKGDVIGCGVPTSAPGSRHAASSASNAAARAQYEAFMASRGQAPRPASEWEAAARAAQTEENLRRIERLRTRGTVKVDGLGKVVPIKQALVKSGPRKGKLKKGYAYGSGHHAGKAIKIR